jgi:RHS repeat-associated protein
VFASTTSAPAYGYDPYGLPLQMTAPVTDFVYGGMVYNADSGLYLTNYRAYDPVAGRWLSRDPLGEETDPAANLYAYVGGEPITSVDPNGENALLAIAGTAALGAAVDIGSQLLSNGGNFGCIDWGSVGLSAGLGASWSSAIIAANFIRAALSKRAAKGLIAGTRTGPPSIDALSRAAATSKRQGFTAAGHALTKHGQGARPGNKVFPSPKGNPQQVNRTAQDVVDDILTTPGSTMTNRYRGRFGQTIEIRTPDGRGIVYDSSGNFLFFREFGRGPI